MASKLPRKFVVRDPGQTRAKLLQATIELIAKKGADAVSVKEVASLSGVSRAAAYQHFQDRRHLLREAHKWITEQLSAIILFPPSGSLEERVAKAATVLLENPLLSQLLIVEMSKGMRKQHPLLGALRSRLKDFHASGRGRQEMDLDVLAFILLGSVPSILWMGELLSTQTTEELAQRFAKEWLLLLRNGLFDPSQVNAPAAPRQTKAVRARKRAR